MNIDYTQLIGLEKITPEDLLQAEELSKGLSKEELVALLDIDVASLSEVETKYLETAIKRGRLLGKKEATNVLFRQMKAKGGGALALTYLKQFADDFKGNGEQGNTFTFIVEK